MIEKDRLNENIDLECIVIVVIEEKEILFEGEIIIVNMVD